MQDHRELYFRVREPFGLFLSILSQKAVWEKAGKLPQAGACCSPTRHLPRPACRCPKGLAPSKAIAQIKQSVTAGRVVTD